MFALIFSLLSPEHAYIIIKAFVLSVCKRKGFVLSEFEGSLI